MQHDGHITLHRNLITYFDEDELVTLCFYIEIDLSFNSFSGGTKQAKAREMILYFRRRGRLRELIKICSEERPNISWPNLQDFNPAI